MMTTRDIHDARTDRPPIEVAYDDITLSLAPATAVGRPARPAA
jgi:hypothetical protein